MCLKVSLDWDNVLYNLEKVHLEFVKENYNYELSSLEVDSWDYYGENFPKVPSIWSDFSLYSTGELISGASEFVDSLKSSGYDVQIVTHSYDEIIEEKTKMIQKLFPGIHIIHAKDKYLHTNGTILIDDAPHNIDNHVNFTNSKGILFDLGYGWGKNHSGERACSYNELITKLNSIELDFIQGN